MSNRSVERAIKTYLIKKENPRNISISDISISELRYLDKQCVVFYQQKYFDGGGYRWTNTKQYIVEKDDIKPYIIGDIIINEIEKHLKIAKHLYSVDINQIEEDGLYYNIKYQGRYFDGGGFILTDIIEDCILIKTIEIKLRQNKIDKIKANV